MIRALLTRALLALSLASLVVSPVLADGAGQTALGQAIQNRAAIATKAPAGLPIIGGLGNSWAAQNYNAQDWLARGYVVATAERLKDRVRLINGGILGFSGASSTTIAPHITDILNAGVRIAIMEMLINNWSGVSFAQTQADVMIVVNACQAYGAICIFDTIPPRNDVNNTATVRAYNARIDDWLFTLPFKYRGIYFNDVAGALTSRASTTGAPYGLVLQSDGVHPLDVAADLISQGAYDILNTLLPPASQGVWQTLGFDRTNYPTGWLNSNPSLTGSTGTCGGSTCSGTPVQGMSGSLATGYAATRPTGTTLTAVFSKIAGVNGGDYQQIVYSCPGGGLSTEEIDVSFNAAGAATGDVAKGLADVTATAMSNVKGVFVYLGGTATGTWRGNLNSGLGSDTTPASFDKLLATPDAAVLATENLTWRLIAQVRCDVAGGGTVAFKRGGIKMVSTGS